MQNNHKYRVSVYLGKDLYEKIETMAKFMGIPVATCTKILLSTGFEMASAMEQSFVKSLEKGETENNGNK